MLNHSTEERLSTYLHTNTNTQPRGFGWRIHCGVEVTVLSTNKQLSLNMKALGVLESKWDPIRKKLVRRLLEEQDKVLRSYFAQKGGTRSKGGDRGNGKGREHVQWDMYA
jgi:hypothetical protein